MTTEQKAPTAVGKFLRGNFVKNIAAPFIRSAVKQVPFVGVPLVELASNLTGAKRLDIATGEVKPKHSYISIIISIAIGVSVVIAVYTKTITIREAIDFLKQFLPTP